KLQGPGPFCEGLGEIRGVCTSFPKMLQPDGAERAVECLRAMDGTEDLCGYDAAEECFMSAITVALVDPAATRRCGAIVQRCAPSRWTSPEMTLQSCERALSAVKSGLEERLVACMEEGCGIRRCVYDLTDH